MKTGRNDKQRDYFRPTLSSSLTDSRKANRKDVKKLSFVLMKDPNQAVVSWTAQL